MRRILAASALTAALFGAAACNATGADNAGGTSPSPSVALVDKKTTCTNFETASTAAGLKMLSAMGDMFNGATETDPAKLEAAAKKLMEDLKIALGEMRAAAEKAAATSADADLKKQFEIVAKEMVKIEAQVAKADLTKGAEAMPEMETPEMEAAGAKIEELCK